MSKPGRKLSKSELKRYRELEESQKQIRAELAELNAHEAELNARDEREAKALLSTTYDGLLKKLNDQREEDRQLFQQFLDQERSLMANQDARTAPRSATAPSADDQPRDHLGRYVREDRTLAPEIAGLNRGTASRENFWAAPVRERLLPGDMDDYAAFRDAHGLGRDNESRQTQRGTPWPKIAGSTIGFSQ